jgi:catechol 2,3-dioxygenase-like lactoylglutathione lyase family enzyme
LFLKGGARSARSTGEPANRRGEPSTPPTTEPTPKQPPPAPKRRAVVAVEAADIEQSIAFYRDLIGLELTRRTPQYASFGGHVLILPSNGSMPRQRQLELEREILFEGRPKIMIFVAPSELEPLRDQLMKAAVPVTSVAAAEAGRRHFSCVDPDGTVVEVREANGGG